MKKEITLLLTLVCIVIITGCSSYDVEPVDTIEGNLKTYCEMSDGTWKWEEHTYKYRLEVSGRIPNAVKDSTFVYLSNIETITFLQAYQAAGLSSHSASYFDAEDAVLVEMK